MVIWNSYWKSRKFPACVLYCMIISFLSCCKSVSSTSCKMFVDVQVSRCTFFVRMFFVVFVALHFLLEAICVFPWRGFRGVQSIRRFQLSFSPDHTLQRSVLSHSPKDCFQTENVHSWYDKKLWLPSRVKADQNVTSQSYAVPDIINLNYEEFYVCTFMHTDYSQESSGETSVVHFYICTFICISLCCTYWICCTYNMIYIYIFIYSIYSMLYTLQNIYIYYTLFRIQGCTCISIHIYELHGCPAPMSPVVSTFSSLTASWPPPECPGSEKMLDFDPTKNMGYRLLSW